MYTVPGIKVTHVYKCSYQYKPREMESRKSLSSSGVVSSGWQASPSLCGRHDGLALWELRGEGWCVGEPYVSDILSTHRKGGLGNFRGNSGVKDCLNCTPEVLGLESAVGGSSTGGGQPRLPDGGA